MKKLISILLTLISVVCIAFAFSACGGSGNDGETDELKWTNDNAVYAYVKSGFENDILKDVEGAFESLNYKKVYATEKNINEWTPLALLFVLEENETADSFINLLEQDERINHATVCRDLYFETVDTRYIEIEKDTIAVGEEMSITLKGGSVDVYIQPFDFSGLFVKPTEEKEYTVQDFKEINLKSVNKKDNGWLYLELSEENYFSVIKALDFLSRLPSMEKVEQDTSNIFLTPPPVWQVSDPTVVKIETNSENYGTAVIKGLKPGKVTVEYAGVRSVSCEITVDGFFEEKEIAKIETRIAFGEVRIYYNPVRTFDFASGTVIDTVTMDDSQIQFLVDEYRDNPELYPDYKNAEEYESYLQSYYNSTEQVASFTQEQGEAFLNEIVSLGIYGWDKEYDNCSFSCGSWYYITVIFTDGTKKETRFYDWYPENYKAIENAFEGYFGAGIYCRK